MKNLTKIIGVLRLMILLFSFFSVQSVFSSDDHGDSFITATQITGQFTSSGLLTAGDEDYFRIDMNSPGWLRITSSGDTDTVGYLYNSSGAQLTADDDSGKNNNFKISYTFRAHGTYYLKVVGYGHSTEGAYQLSISSDDGSVSAVISGAALTYNAALRNKRVEMGHAVLLGAYETRELTLENTGTTALNPRVLLSNSSFTVFDLPNTLYPGRTAHFTVGFNANSIGAQSSLISILHDNDSLDRFYVSARVEDSHGDTHGDSFSSATNVGTFRHGWSKSESGSLRSDDTDVFRLTLLQSGDLGVGFSGDVAVYLSDASGFQLAFDSDRGLVSKNDIPAGDYYVSVVPDPYTSRYNLTSTYSLSFTFRGIYEDSFIEPT